MIEIFCNISIFPRVSPLLGRTTSRLSFKSVPTFAVVTSSWIISRKAVALQFFKRNSIGNELSQNLWNNYAAIQFYDPVCLGVPVCAWMLLCGTVCQWACVRQCAFVFLSGPETGCECVYLYVPVWMCVPACNSVHLCSCVRLCVPVWAWVRLCALLFICVSLCKICGLQASSYSIRIRIRKLNKKFIMLLINDDPHPHPQYGWRSASAMRITIRIRIHNLNPHPHPHPQGIPRYIVKVFRSNLEF